jgi:hypothetical protein
MTRVGKGRCTARMDGLFVVFILSARLPHHEDRAPHGLTGPNEDRRAER